MRNIGDGGRGSWLRSKPAATSERRHARSARRRRVFGRGFNSRRLHQPSRSCQAKVARRSFSEGGPTQSLTRYGWQANFSLRLSFRPLRTRRLHYVSGTAIRPCGYALLALSPLLSRVPESLSPARPASRGANWRSGHRTGKSIRRPAVSERSTTRLPIGKLDGRRADGGRNLPDRESTDSGRA